MRYLLAVEFTDAAPQSFERWLLEEKSVGQVGAKLARRSSAYDNDQTPRGQKTSLFWAGSVDEAKLPSKPSHVVHINYPRKDSSITPIRFSSQYRFKR